MKLNLNSLSISYLKLCVFFIISFTTYSESQGQIRSTKTKDHFGITTGVGANDFWGSNVNLGGFYEHKGFTGSLRYSYNENYSDGDYPILYMEEYALMVGWSTRHINISEKTVGPAFSISAGPALINYNRREEVKHVFTNWLFGGSHTTYSKSEHQTIGVTLEMQFILTGTYFGSGISVFATHYDGNTLAGMTFFLQTGFLKN